MAQRRFPAVLRGSLDAHTNLIFHQLMLTISVTANENHAYNQSPSTTPITLK